jgi:hypothetical protein
MDIESISLQILELCTEVNTVINEVENLKNRIDNFDPTGVYTMQSIMDRKDILNERLSHMLVTTRDLLQTVQNFTPMGYQIALGNI